MANNGLSEYVSGVPIVGTYEVGPSTMLRSVAGESRDCMRTGKWDRQFGREIPKPIAFRVILDDPRREAIRSSVAITRQQPFRLLPHAPSLKRSIGAGWWSGGALVLAMYDPVQARATFFGRGLPGSPCGSGTIRRSTSLTNTTTRCGTGSSRSGG